MKSNINVSAITEDKALQKISADLSILDIAGSQVKLAVSELKLFLTISNKEQQADAMALLKLCKDVEKAIETKRKELVTPFNNSVKQINDYAKTLTTDLSGAIDKVKQACLKFQKDEEERALQARTTSRQGILVQLGFIYEAGADAYKHEAAGSITSNEVRLYDDIQFANIIAAYQETIQRFNQQQVAQLNEEKELLEMFGNDDDVQTITNQIALADINPVVAVPPVNGMKVDKLKGTTKTWTFEYIDASLIPRDFLMPDEVKINQGIRAGIREIPGIKIYQKEGLSIR
jgi:hypothetical protein